MHAPIVRQVALALLPTVGVYDENTSYGTRVIRSGRQNVGTTGLISGGANGRISHGD